MKKRTTRTRGKGEKKYMQNMLPARIVLAGMLGWAAAAKAEVLALNPAQDASVKWGYGGRIDDKGVVGNNDGNRWKFYIQFDLPGGTAGGITNASLDLVVRDSVSRQLDVVLLTNETIDAWDEATITFATAPGSVDANVDQNYSATSYDLADTALLLDNETVGEAVDVTHHFDLSSSVALLNTDTDNKLTFVVSGAQTSTAQPSFYFSEVAGKEPVLNLEYTPDPTIGFAVLEPDADIDIRSADLATNGYDRTVLWVQNNGDPSVNRAAKAYIRYKLPPDFGEAASATFTIIRNNVGPWAWTYEVSGMDDGIPNEADWSSANGNGVGTTWNNAPANITTSAYQFTNATLLGTFQVAKAADGGVAGDSWSISGADLVDFLNGDSNGYVTLMIGRSGLSSSSEGFASQSNETYGPPTLSIYYVKVDPYLGWIGQYPAVGSATNKTDNPDGDSLDNLSEWGLGGDPANPLDVGHVPVSGTIDIGGTNWFEYVYAKRNNADALGLSYSVEQNTDLAIGSWKTNAVDVLGSGTLDSEFDTVTNRVQTDVEDRQFLKLLIKSN